MGRIDDWQARVKSQSLRPERIDGISERSPATAVYPICLDTIQMRLTRKSPPHKRQIWRTAAIATLKVEDTPGHRGAERQIREKYSTAAVWTHARMLMELWKILFGS